MSIKDISWWTNMKELKDDSFLKNDEKMTHPLKKKIICDI